MATDVDVQYFSHLNGLVLGNNWGDLIRLLDKALVTGIDFTQITAASIDAQGDVHITLFAAHNALLFQVVELSGFSPNSLNQKYRIKGVPNTTQLILKPALDITERSITTMGTGKLASLGYDIIFRDTNDVKRVYRAKNPKAQHPFIRVDESLTSPDGSSGIYNSAYAKYAMVGLIENMAHIDDYSDTSKLQLPLDTADFAKNWKISGTGSSVVRGWSKWHWRRHNTPYTNASDSIAPSGGSAKFTLVGNKDAFYLMTNVTSSDAHKLLRGAGIFDSALPDNIVPPWFLMSFIDVTAASAYLNFGGGNIPYSTPLIINSIAAKFLTPAYNVVSRIVGSVDSSAITPDLFSGKSALYDGTDVAALGVPIVDANKKLRGTLKHILYNGKSSGADINTMPILSDGSMYVMDSGVAIQNSAGVQSGFYFYLGELE